MEGVMRDFDSRAIILWYVATFIAWVLLLAIVFYY
jgi:hypothetical protein